MSRLQICSKSLVFAALVGAASLAPGCQAEKHVLAHEQGTYPVTNPKRAVTEIEERYVCQIHAIQHIELRSLERGYLQKIYVDEGQQVKKGQRMFQIMPALFQAELQRDQAEAQFAQIEYENTKLLADSDVVSGKELALAKARLDKARAEMSLTRVHRDLTEIRAPFSGIMNRLEVRQGSLLEEGELLTTLSDNSQMWVYFNVTESEYLDYKQRRLNAEEDEKPVVELEMANGQRFAQTGIVDAIGADFNNETGTISFRATFPNPDGLLRHGETGNVVMKRRIENALLVPQKATFEILDKRYVFVVDEAGKVRSEQVVVTAELPHVFVVDSELTDTDQVLLEGLRKVQDGEQINVSFVPPAEAFENLAPPAE